MDSQDLQESQETQDQSPQEPQQESPQEAPDEPEASNQQADLEDDVDLSDLFDPDLPEDEPQEDSGESQNDFEQYKEAVNAMLRGGPGAGDAARRILMESGYSAQEADQFVKNAGYDGEKASPQREEQGVDPRLAESLEAANQRAASAERRAQEVRAKQLEQELDYRLYETMSGSELGGFISKLDQINKDEDDKSRNDRRQVMAQEIRRTALENLGNRTRKANRFDESWISEEVSRASGQVMGRYRAAIGNIDSIGRSSVASTPEEELRRSKPVSSPAWKPGKQVSDLDLEIKDWTVDVLSRAALEDGAGQTKL